MNINGILIGSEHPGPMVEYYTKLFGTPQWDESGYTGWQIGSGAITISAHDQVKGKNAQPGRFIWNIESDDVRGEFERFKAAGRDRRHRTVRARHGHCDGHDRDLRRPRRQLLPAGHADPDVGGAAAGRAGGTAVRTRRRGQSSQTRSWSSGSSIGDEMNRTCGASSNWPPCGVLAGITQTSPFLTGRVSPPTVTEPVPSST